MPNRTQILAAAWTAAQFLGRLAAGAFALLAIVFLGRLIWAGAGASWNLAWNGPANLLKQVATATGADRYLKVPPPPSAPTDPAGISPAEEGPPVLPFGGPEGINPTATAAQARERKRRSDEELLAAERLSLLAEKQGEWQKADKDILLGTPNAARLVKVTVFDASQDADGDGKPDQVAVPHTVIIDQDGTVQEIALSGQSSAYPKVGFGPVHFRVMARIDGRDSLSAGRTVDFSNKETGSKDIQLIVP